MAHPEWCGKICAYCRKPCELDKTIPCSPDCPELSSETGEPDGKECELCDVIF